MNNFLIVLIIAISAVSCVKQETIRVVPSSEGVAQKNSTDNKVEGTINGGGGKGILCAKNNTKSIEVLDLYEARVLYGLNIKHKPQTEDEALDLVIALITKHFWNPDTIPMGDFQKIAKESFRKNFYNNIKFISAGQKLKLVNDSFEPLVEQGCEMVQIAVYYDESLLLVDKELWDQLDWLNKMALIAHEGFYFQDRQNGSTNSMASRKLVGQLFSEIGARPKAEGVPIDSVKRARCYVSDNSIRYGYFYAYDSQKDLGYAPPDQMASGLEIVFNYLKTNTFLFRTSGFFSRMSLTDLFADTSNNAGESDLYVESYLPNQSLYLKLLGKGEARLTILDNKTGIKSNELQVSCYLE